MSTGGGVTAVSAGTTTISYTVTGCGGTASATAIVTVSPIDGISGHVLFGSGTPYGSNVKVWLITYNPSTMDLEAADSMWATNVSGGTDFYYQFVGVATDSFRMKAATADSAGYTSSYIPTYHDTSFYWHDATVLNHTAGTADINQNINMLSGTPASGPGFIGGSVLTGANRSTSGGGIPVVGMHMAILNTSTSTIAGMAFTDAAGNYSFSNLPYGTYTVFPDSVNYATIPLTSIVLSSGSGTYNAANFIQHTTSKTITPGTTGVNNIVAISSVSAFPNPTSGKLNIQWNEKATEKANVIITDITGREVYSSSVAFTVGSGVTNIDLSELTNGVYVFNIKTATLSYNSKIEVRH